MRLLATMIAALGVTTAAQAQGPQDVVTLLNNVDGALNTAVTHSQQGTLALLEGDVTQTFNNFEQANTGFATQLAANTPGEPLAATIDDFSRTVYEALVPVYQMADGPAMQVSNALAPLRDPAVEAISGFEYELSLEFAAPALPGTGALPGLDTLSGGSLGADALPLGSLPLDSLDPSTLTALAGDASLPGLAQ